MSNVWGQGFQRTWHRLDGVAHGDQVVRCGRRVDVHHVYHVDPEAGPDAEPCIGAVCPECTTHGRGLVKGGWT